MMTLYVITCAINFTKLTSLTSSKKEKKVLHNSLVRQFQAFPTCMKRCIASFLRFKRR